jgi:hypothetical protein
MAFGGVNDLNSICRQFADFPGRFSAAAGIARQTSREGSDLERQFELIVLTRVW